MRAEIKSRCTLEVRFLGYLLESDELLCQMGFIYVTASGDLHTLVLSEAHCALYSADLGVKKMHVDLKQLYFWVGMRSDVANFIDKFLECKK